MKKEDIYMQLFNFSRPTYYKWKRDEVPALKLIETFSDAELIQFLESGYLIQNKDKQLIEYVRFNLSDKLHKIFATKGEGIIDKLNKLIPNKIFISILDDIKNDQMFEVQQSDSKETLLNRIKGYEAYLHEGPSKKQLVGIIEKTLSNIECYVLIKHHEEILAK